MNKVKTNRPRYYFRWFLWILLAQFILANISAAMYAYKFTHFYNNPGEWNVAHPKNIFDKTWKLFKGPVYGKNEVEALPSFPYQNIKFTLGNNDKIDVWYSPVPNSNGAVCLFHGLTSNKAFYLPEAQFFHDKGYTILLLDFRGHGKSDGMKTSIGYYESEEVNLAYNFLKKKGENHIFLFGGSMGAVAVARAVAQYQLDPSGIILEFPFDKLSDHIKARGRSFGFPPTLFSLPVTFWISIENSFPAFSHKTSDYAKRINCPVLLQWGTMDHLVTAKETNTIFKNFSSKAKKLVIYDEVVHSSIFRQQPVKWEKEIQQFLDTY